MLVLLLLLSFVVNYRGVKRCDILDATVLDSHAFIGPIFVVLLVTKKGQIMQHATNVGQYITVAGAAKMLGMKPNSFYKRIRRRNIPAIKVGRTVMVRV